MCGKVRGEFAEFLGEFSRSVSNKSRGEKKKKKKLVCPSLREISRRFLRESSRLRIFVCGVNAKKKSFFSWADLYVNNKLI